MIPSAMNFDKPDDFKYPGVSPPNYTGMRDMFSCYALSKLAGQHPLRIRTATPL
jgi:hypothetical protein